jgi:hypothetical protein
MQLAEIGVIIDPQQLGLCLELASRTKIECSYVIGCDSTGEDASAHLTSSFSDAFKLLQSNTIESMSVIFDWTIGDRLYSDWIPYELPANLIVTEHFVEQSIRNLIHRRIAFDLYDHLYEAEYNGPVNVVEDHTDFGQLRLVA